MEVSWREEGEQLVALRDENDRVGLSAATPVSGLGAGAAFKLSSQSMEWGTHGMRKGRHVQADLAQKPAGSPALPQEAETISADLVFRHGAMANILLIEDDKETAAEVKAELGDRGYVVDWAADGVAGLDKARSGTAKVVIVDRLLPGMDGLTIVEALRSGGIRTPVLVLSALGAVDDRVRGLRAGGDDYLTKPFATAELVARIEALLRRPADSRDALLRVGPLELDLMERTAKRGNRVIDLLPREFRLLEYMMRRKDQVLTRAMLLEEVWKYKFVPRTNLVDVHMGRLRHKVDDPREPSMIHNVRGVGFVLRAPA